MRVASSFMISEFVNKKFRYSLIWANDRNEPYISLVFVALPAMATFRMPDAISNLLRYFI